MRVLLNCVGLLLGVVPGFYSSGGRALVMKTTGPGSIPGGDWHFFASHVLASVSSFKLL